MTDATGSVETPATIQPVCRHWVGSDAKGHICGAPVDDEGSRCAKHQAVEQARVTKMLQVRREQAERANEAWVARNAAKLPQWRAQLERAESEYASRTAAPVTDRAAVGGAMHGSIVRAQRSHLSDTNVARVVELERIIKSLRADIARAERLR